MAEAQPGVKRPIIGPALLAPLLGLVAAIACGIVGTIVGFVVSDRGAGTDTAAVPGVVGFLFGFLAGLMIGAVAAGWLLTRGRNHAPATRVLAGLWFPAGVWAGLTVHYASSQSGLPLLGLLVGAAVCGLVFVAMVVGSDGGAKTRGIALGCAALLALGGLAAGSLNEDNAFANRLDESGIPLVVVNQDELGSALPGWQIVEYDTLRGASSISRVGIDLVTDTDFRLTLDARAGDPGPCSTALSCSDLAPLDDGSAVTWVRNDECLEYVGRVRVERPTGTWAVGPATSWCSDSAGQPTIEEMQLFLTTLEAATPQQMADATP